MVSLTAKDLIYRTGPRTTSCWTGTSQTRGLFVHLHSLKDSRIYYTFKSFTGSLLINPDNTQLVSRSPFHTCCKNQFSVFTKEQIFETLLFQIGPQCFIEQKECYMADTVQYLSPHKILLFF